MEKQVKRKRALWGAGAILVVAGLLLSVFLQSPAQEQKDYLIYEGDEKLIEKTQEQKTQFVFGCSEIPQSSFVCGESGKTAQQIGAFLFQSMVNLSPSQEAEFQLAKDVSFSEDGKKAVITLNDTDFSDGSRLTSQEVMDSFLGLMRRILLIRRRIKCGRSKGWRSIRMGWLLLLAVSVPQATTL